MLDIQFIRDNRDLVETSAKQKGVKLNIKQLLELDEQRRMLQTRADELRRKRNEHVATMQGKPSDEQIAKGKKLKDELAELEGELQPVEDRYNEVLQTVPNVIPDDTPEGGEDDNKPVKHWGEVKKDFEVVDHQTWGEQNNMIDFERGAKVAGNKFYYLKGSLVELELAVFQFALQLASKHGFTPITVPHMVNTRTASGTGYLPKGEERQIYKIEGEDLNLIATAEIPITGYHADEIFEAKDLPVLYVGLSPAYRMEAGAYGKHSRGLYRVHQFNKLEMYVFCKPEDSENWHKKLVEFEEELCKALEIPYQLVRIAAGDLGGPAYKKFDIEYWSPVDKSYRELMSCSNVTDYQARRLNIRYRDENGKVKLVHTLNGTAAAYSRVAIALIENQQQADGTVKVPKALQPYMAGKEVL